MRIFFDSDYVTLRRKMELEASKQQRRAVRAAFTKIVNKLEEVLKSKNPDVDDMDIFLEQLEEKRKQLRICDDAILKMVQEKGCTQKDYDTEYNAAEEYHDKFIALKMKTKKLISKNNSTRSTVDVTEASTSATPKYRLPEIELRKFNGDPREWLNFWSQFEKIHLDPNIDGRDKFQYLIQSTEPRSKPREIVESFPATADNYTKAVEHLQQRFGEESVLIQVYVRGILELIICDKKKMDLVSLYDKLQTKLSALESLGLTKNKYADFLFPLVESSLPPELIKIWSRNRNLNAEEKGKSDLDSLIEFLKNEVQNDERLKLVRDSFMFDKINNKKNVKYSECDKSIPTALELLATNKNYDNGKFNNVKRYDLCIFCDKVHASESCSEASSMTLEVKKNIIKSKNACFVCLKKGHRSNQCKSKHRCLICKHRHFVILCPDLPLKSDNFSDREKESDKTKISTLNNYTQLSDVYLQTLIVKLQNGPNQMFIRAIYDSGSMKSYISEDIVEFMNFVPIGETKIRQSLFGGVETPESIRKNYLIELGNVDNSYKCKLEVLSEKRICSDIKRIPSGQWLNELKFHKIKINDLENNKYKVNDEIKLLIGADMAGRLLTGKIVNLKSGITAIQTKLGWTVMGKFNSSPDPDSNSSSSASLLISSLLAKDQCISNLWKLDILGITEPSQTKTKAQLQEDTQKYFEETLSVNSEGRYEVALPWVLESSLLPDNKINAEKCILSAKRKLINSGKFEDYCKVFEEWLKLGIIEEATNDKQVAIHYLPHRAVVKENSTTSIRPVFNASFHLHGFPSLNDCLSTGPNLIETIPSILNRFRKNYVGITSDIEKAFLQIAIREKDRDFLRFMWFSGENREQVKIYRHRRVVFGITCSPYLLAATLQYHLSTVTESLKDTADILKAAFYVDNCVTSLTTETEMEKFVLESKRILASGHFNLRCWKSNLNSDIFDENSSQGDNISLLGLMWNTGTDTLSCKIEKLESPELVTKRRILAVAHQVFDVIGYTAPVMLIPKIILQETWSTKLRWDDVLTNDLVKRFKLWYQKLHLLSNISLPRWFGLKSHNESISLHLFCDSSKKAYGACVFIRVENKNEVKINLVNAKSRVAPIKPITIPRLELLACSIGARLLSSVVSDLKLVKVNIYCWTDSSTALCWIQREQNWGTFIHNRVKEIRSLTSPTVWHHIPGNLNPADLLSRGCSAEQLIEQKWWEGPHWLRDKEENWPKSTSNPNEDLVNSEVRKTILVSLAKNDEVKWYCKYFSSFKKTVRMIAWIYRFYNNVKNVNKNLSRDLSLPEIDRAEIAILSLVQRESFKGEKDDKLKQLRPIVDCHGLIRAKSGVAFRDDVYDFKFPIILPSDHPVVKMLIINAHNELLHAGTSLIMTNLRERFWILKSRKTIRNCIRNCVKCQRFKAKRCETIPGILPSDRVRDACVFEIVGCDLAGPLFLKNGQKAYIVLFTCAVYRAIHLELITSLTTECFLQSLRRFIARRGRPSTIYSDNGTNFVGADKVLRSIDWDSLRFKATEQKIQWKFNPPSAAWWGGWWERLIQIVKQTLRKILGRASLDYEEFLTVLCDCERIVNSRPLTYVSEEIDNDLPLTPENFLHETPQSGVPDIDNVDKLKLSKRIKYLQRMKDLLRARFRSEYLGQLRQETIRNYKSKPLQVGEIVLLEDDNKKRTYWNLARVTKVIPGRDGQIRLALVKTSNSELLRPVQRLFRLELDNPVSKVDDEIVPLTTSSGRIIKRSF